MEPTIVTNVIEIVAAADPTWGAVLTRYALALLNALLLVITLCLPILVRHLIGWLSSKRSHEWTAEEREIKEARQRRLEEIIITATSAVGQTYVSSLKQAAKDGKLTDEEKAEAMKKTILMVKKHLLTEGIDSQSELLEDYIEEAVARLKA